MSAVKGPWRMDKKTYRSASPVRLLADALTLYCRGFVRYQVAVLQIYAPVAVAAAVYLAFSGSRMPAMPTPAERVHIDIPTSMGSAVLPFFMLLSEVAITYIASWQMLDVFPSTRTARDFTRRRRGALLDTYIVLMVLCVIAAVVILAGGYALSAFHFHLHILDLTDRSEAAARVIAAVIIGLAQTPLLLIVPVVTLTGQADVEAIRNSLRVVRHVWRQALIVSIVFSAIGVWLPLANPENFTRHAVEWSLLALALQIVWLPVGTIACALLYDQARRLQPDTQRPEPPPMPPRASRSRLVPWWPGCVLRGSESGHWLDTSNPPE